jgi:YggT family protein
MLNLELIAILVRAIAQVLIWVVIASALLSFFVSPYHPVRQVLDRIVEPLLSPIRRILPPAGSLDFSPLVLILLLELTWRVLYAAIVSVVR